MKSLLCMLLVLMAFPAFADSLEIAQTPASVKAQAGESVPISVTLKNTLTPRQSIMLRASVEWTDQYGTPRLSEATTEISVIQPVKMSRYAVLVAGFRYVDDSATLNGNPVETFLIADELTFLLGGLVLLEGESATLVYTLRMQ